VMHVVTHEKIAERSAINGGAAVAPRSD
jgi:hypothetical protein